MKEDILEGQVTQQLLSKEDHPSNPEEDDIVTSLQKRAREESSQVICVVGQPSTEKGKRPEENQVSRTSGSCSSSTSASGTLNLAAALLFASASLRPETQYASSVESAFAFPLMVTW
jgi:hypothetical protein